MDALWGLTPGAPIFFIEGGGQLGISGVNWGNGFATDTALVTKYGLSGEWCAWCWCRHVVATASAARGCVRGVRGRAPPPAPCAASLSRAQHTHPTTHARTHTSTDPNPFFKALLRKSYRRSVVISPHVYGPSVSGVTEAFKGADFWKVRAGGFFLCCACARACACCPLRRQHYTPNPLWWSCLLTPIPPPTHTHAPPRPTTPHPNPRCWTTRLAT